MLFKNLISIEVCHFLTHFLLKSAHEKKLNGSNHGDIQVPNALVLESHSTITDTVNEIVWPKLEKFLDEKLIPTYSYSRLYQNNNDLKIHKDRPSCEVSVTLQLGRSHHYSWPIYVDDKRYDLAEGDGVVYFGHEQYHWRNSCDGPEGYYSGQIFLHYVRENGKFKEFAGDKRWGKEIPFKRNRSEEMVTK